MSVNNNESNSRRRKPINLNAFKNSENESNRSSDSSDRKPVRMRPLNIPPTNKESDGGPNHTGRPNSQRIRKPLNIPSTNDVNTESTSVDKSTLSTPESNGSSTPDNSSTSLSNNTHVDDVSKSNDSNDSTHANNTVSEVLNDSDSVSSATNDSSSGLINGSLSGVSLSTNDENNGESTLVRGSKDSGSISLSDDSRGIHNDSKNDFASRSDDSTSSDEVKPVFKFNPNVRKAFKESVSDSKISSRSSEADDFNSGDSVGTPLDSIGSNDLESSSKSDRPFKLSFNRGRNKVEHTSNSNVSDESESSSSSFSGNGKSVESDLNDGDSLDGELFKGFAKAEEKDSRGVRDASNLGFDSDYSAVEDGFIDGDSLDFDDDFSESFDDNLVDETVQFYDDTELSSSSKYSLDDVDYDSSVEYSSVDSAKPKPKRFIPEAIEEDNSTFEGFDSADNVESFDGMLDDLFGGDDEELEAFSKFKNDSSVSESSSELLSRVVSNTGEDIVPTGEDAEVKAGQRELKSKIRGKMKRDRAVAREELSRIAADSPVSKPVDTRSKPVPIDSLDTGFRKSNVREVLVDEHGEVVSKVVASADASVSVESKDRERYRYLSKDGKMNVAELEFFKNLAKSKAEVKANPDLLEGVRSPLGWNESEAERKVRADKIVRALEGKDAFKRNNRLRFSQKDRELLQFLALFRYATDAQLSRMFSEAIGTTYNRLKKLRQQGLVIDKKIYGNRPIWFLTSAGMILSGYDLPRITESKLTFSMFPHQFTVNNTAANLWGANINVLNQDGFPALNRTDDKGKRIYGESLVSELEIQSSFGKMRMFDRSDVYRPQLLGRIDKEFKQWEAAGGPEFGDSPEMQYGNEYMWALYPPMALRVAYHVPDLVIKRPRNPDGSPNSIAVEIEISNKALDSYERTLRAYKADKRLYKKVVWVCKNTGPARKLIQVARDIGLHQEGGIDIVPIITENGVFKERDLWTI